MVKLIRVLINIATTNNNKQQHPSQASWCLLSDANIKKDVHTRQWYLQTMIIRIKSIDQVSKEWIQRFGFGGNERKEVI